MQARSPPVRVIANGNIYSRSDVNVAASSSSPAVGLMSAEGILRDPSLFAPQETSIRLGESAVESLPDRNCLFQEYCDLSEKYRVAGGWDLLQRVMSFDEPVQLYIAR